MVAYMLFSLSACGDGEKKEESHQTKLQVNRHKEAHLNSLGYKIMADLVYKKGVELGYWK